MGGNESNPFELAKSLSEKDANRISNTFNKLYDNSKNPDDLKYLAVSLKKDDCLKPLINNYQSFHTKLFHFFTFKERHLDIKALNKEHNKRIVSSSGLSKIGFMLGVEAIVKGKTSSIYYSELENLDLLLTVLILNSPDPANNSEKEIDEYYRMRNP